MSAAATVSPVPTPSEELVYDFGVESLLRALGSALTPELKAKMKDAGIDTSKKLLPGYPRAVWERSVALIAVELSQGDLAVSQRALGARLTQGFAGTALGRMLAPAVRLTGVKRAMKQLPRNLTITNNFMKVTLEELAPTEVRVTASQACPSADFLAGVIEGIARYAGAATCEVSFSQAGTQTVFAVRWT